MAASGQASMAGEGGSQRMTVAAQDLPALGPGQYYEVYQVIDVSLRPTTANPAHSKHSLLRGRYA